MKRLTNEEERDRQQLQITRRRFFFLGFGAAAAAATRKLLPQSEYVQLSKEEEFFLEGPVVPADAFTLYSKLTEEMDRATSSRAAQIYFDKEYVRKLSQQLAQAAFCQPIRYPLVKDGFDDRKMLEYIPIPLSVTRRS
jgi:hypothetical protein